MLLKKGIIVEGVTILGNAWVYTMNNSGQLIMIWKKTGKAIGDHEC